MVDMPERPTKNENSLRVKKISTHSDFKFYVNWYLFILYIC